MLVMLLGSVNIDKRFVFKTWNNGKSNEESYLVKKTTLELLENGDKEFFHLAEKTISWLRQDTEDYKFYGRLRKKRKKGEYEEIIEKCSEERSIGFIAAAPQEKYCSSSYLVKLERSVSCLVELCPMNEMGVVATLNLVTYYNIIHGGKLRNAVDFMKDRLNELHSKNIKYSDIECHFTNEQVRKSGISKEAEIVLAVIDYMLNGNFRQTYEYRYFSYPNCSADDFFVSIYSILYLEKYWEKTREEYGQMMKEFFEVNVKIGNMNKWLQRYGYKFAEWDKTEKARMRRRLAETFLSLINEVKKAKLNELKW